MSSNLPGRFSSKAKLIQSPSLLFEILQDSGISFQMFGGVDLRMFFPNALQKGSRFEVQGVDATSLRSHDESPLARVLNRPQALASVRKRSRVSDSGQWGTRSKWSFFWEHLKHANNHRDAGGRPTRGVSW